MLLYISTSCKIDNHSIFKDQNFLFDKKEEADVWLFTIYQHFRFDYPRFYKMDNLSKLGWLAAEILLNNNLHKKYRPEEVGIVLINRSSSLDTDIKYFETLKKMASPALFVYTLPNIVMGEISIRHHLKGENTLFVSKEFDKSFLQYYIQNLFESNAVESCICGWLEFFGSEAEAALYFVEKINNETAIPFTEENISNIYHLKYGKINGRSEGTDH